MHIIDTARAVLDTYDPNVVAHGLTERLNVAASNSVDERTIAAPQYLNDLGVGHSADPQSFWESHLELFEWPVQFSSHDNADLMLRQTPDEAVTTADATVLLVGDYANTAAALEPILPELTRAGSADSLSRVGVLLAAVNDLRALSMFSLVVERGTVRQSIAASHRYAATQIKRANDAAGGRLTLESLEASAERKCHASEISTADAHAVGALVSNLKALAEIRMGDLAAARREIDRAKDFVTGSGDTIVTRAEALRYEAQIAINDAQLAFSEGEPGRAGEILDNNVAHCRLHSPDYLSEALTAQGIGLIKQREFRRAISTLVETTQAIREQASPGRLRHARRLLVAALSEAGLHDRACRILWLIRHDALGLYDSIGPLGAGTA